MGASCGSAMMTTTSKFSDPQISSSKSEGKIKKFDEEEEEDFPPSLKVLFLGDQSVGKTSILKKYIHNKFRNTQSSTVGVDFLDISIPFNEKDVHVQVWDTAGQERYRSIVGSYFRGAHMCILVYDITSKKSFLNIPKWNKDIQSHCVEMGGELKVFLVGNKCDLEEERSVTAKEANECVKEFNFISFLETSAKEGTNIEELFEEMLKKYLERMREELKNEKEEKYKEIEQKNKKEN